VVELAAAAVLEEVQYRILASRHERGRKLRVIAHGHHPAPLQGRSGGWAGRRQEGFGIAGVGVGIAIGIRRRGRDDDIVVSFLQLLALVGGGEGGKAEVVVAVVVNNRIHFGRFVCGICYVVVCYVVVGFLDLS